MLREKFIATSDYQKLKKVSKHSLMMYLKFLEKQEQAKTKPSRMKELINSRPEVNDVVTKRTIHRLKEIEFILCKERSCLRLPQLGLPILRNM